MNKDLKIGMGIGLLLAMAATFWLATRPSLSTKARLLDTQNTKQQNPADQPVPQTETPDNISDAVPQSQPEPAVETVTSKKHITPPAAAKHKTDSPRFHTVSKDETLSGISQKYYGNSSKWQKILEVNRDVIKNPANLIPGTKLIIPQDKAER
jgi:nucleoid-associated protein YgaU